MTLPHPLPAEYARTVADRFRLLGDPTRLMLMDLLRDGERSVGTLAAWTPNAPVGAFSFACSPARRASFSTA